MLLGGGWLPRVTGGSSLRPGSAGFSYFLLAKGGFSAPSPALSYEAVPLPPTRRHLLCLAHCLILPSPPQHAQKHRAPSLLQGPTPTEHGRDFPPTYQQL